MSALATAQRLIDKFGGAVTLTHTVLGQFDTTTGRRDNDAALSYTTRGVVLAPTGGGGDTFDGVTTTRTQYRTVYVAGGGLFVPITGDIVTFEDGTTGSVKGVSSIAPTGDPENAAVHELTVLR